MKNKFIKIIALFLMLSPITPSTLYSFQGVNYAISAEMPNRKGINTNNYFNKGNSYKYASDNSETDTSNDSKKHILFFWNTFKNTVYDFESRTVEEGDYYGELPTPSAEGYKFLGWYTDHDEGEKITSSSRVAGTGLVIYIYSRWEKEEKQYKVSFMTFTDETFEPVMVTYGEPYGVLPIPTRKDYKFLGWYTSSVGGTNITSSTKAELNSDITLYARWEKEEKQYKVSFTTFTDETFEPKTVVYGEPYGALPSPIRKGYKFLGWYTSSVGGANVTSSTKAELNSDITLYAHWEKEEKQYKVSFEAFTDETFEPVTVIYGEPYGKLPSPIKKGYKFLGWYTSSVGGANVTSSTKAELNSNITLYAHWEKEEKKYKVNFVALNGETLEPKTVIPGEYYGTLPVPTRKGYKFLSWNTEPSGGGTKITSLSKVEINYDINLYAVWEKNRYTVEFIDNNTNASFASKTLFEDDEFGSLPSPTRKGYNFLGWFRFMDESKTSMAQYKVTETTKVYASYSGQKRIQLYAKWERAKYFIYFDPAGGEIRGIGAINNKTVLFDEFYGILPIPEKDGHIFKGWFTDDEDGEQVYEYTRVPALEDISQTLYAHWEEAAEEHIVFFDPNGGYLDEEDMGKTVVFNGEYGPMPKPSRKGYDFQGWFTKKKGGEQIYGNDIFESHHDITLYARWKKLANPVYKKILTKLSYNFSNSNEGFDYAYNYRIPLKYFQLVYGKTNLARDLYESLGFWRGSCHGMATTSVMFYNKNIIKPSAFKKGAKSPADLKLSNKNAKKNLSLKKFIEIMQISQFDYQPKKVYSLGMNKISKLVKDVKKANKTGKNPVVIGIFGRSGGHAVVGYAVEDFKNGKSRLYVYDPNFPKTERYITLKRDSKGVYTDWYYLFNNTEKWGSDYGGEMDYTPNKEYTKTWKRLSKKKIAADMIFTYAGNDENSNVNKKVKIVLKTGRTNPESKMPQENKDVKKVAGF